MLEICPNDLQKTGCINPYMPFNGHQLKAYPCGHCIFCRQKKGREWTQRLTLEYQDFKENSCFITLTYKETDPINDTENFDHSRNFHKEDYQNFIRKVKIYKERKGEKLTNKNFKYFCAGERGEKGTKRIHWHLIIFGMKADEMLEMIKRYWHWGDINDAQEIYDSENIAKYVSQYVVKKIGQENKNEAIMHCSKGIGLRKAKELFTEPIKQAWESYRTIQGVIVWNGKKIYFDRYLREKLCEPQMLEKVKAENMEAMKENILETIEIYDKFAIPGLIPENFIENKYDTNKHHKTRLAWQYRYINKHESNTKFLKLMIFKKSLRSNTL